MEPSQELTNSTNPIGIKKLRDAIPPHCLKPCVPTSVYYLVRDVALCSFLVMLALRIPSIPFLIARVFAWALYGMCQGLVFTGLWIFAHECGHQALFKTRLVNDGIGWIIHSTLLVPYFSWKFSHAQHHRYTNHLEKDTAFVPATTRQSGLSAKFETLYETAEDAPILNLMVLVGHQLVGWPLYLFSHITSGPKSGYDENRKGIFSSNHFNPFSGMFSTSQRWHILVSDLGLLFMVLILAKGVHHSGATQVLLLYGVPYLWVNHWIVAITYLHHTHPSANHFGSDSWTFEKGALAAVDRDFGFIGKNLFHGIIDFHVIHHLFTKIPFYHAEEATKAIQPVLGQRYIRDDTPFFKALWMTFCNLKYVKPLTPKSQVFVWAEN